MQCGTFPPRRDTVTAEVLAKLINGEKLTGMDAVSSANTTRLASKVHDLRRIYGWDITSTPVTVPTADGRWAEICEYSLSALIVESAKALGGAQFCESVKVARDALRRAWMATAE